MVPGDREIVAVIRPAVETGQQKNSERCQHIPRCAQAPPDPSSPQQRKWMLEEAGRGRRRLRGQLGRARGVVDASRSGGSTGGYITGKATKNAPLALGCTGRERRPKRSVFTSR